MSTANINVAMNSAISGLSANQVALSTTSNNIANANTVGYTHKRVNLETVKLDGQGAGVRVADITRNVNEFLLRDVRAQTSLQANTAVQSEFFSYTQDMFGKPESASSIASRITSLSTSLQALTVDPSSNNAQISVVNNALNATRQLNEMSDKIQSLRDQADDGIKMAVTEVNTLLSSITHRANWVVTASDDQVHQIRPPSPAEGIGVEAKTNLEVIRGPIATDFRVIGIPGTNIGSDLHRWTLGFDGFDRFCQPVTEREGPKC